MVTYALVKDTRVYAGNCWPLGMSESERSWKQLTNGEK